MYMPSNKICKSGLKIHMGLHFPIYVRLLGAACAWDMTTYERSHKPLKVIFKGTSQRVESTTIEIINRIERRTVISDALRAVRAHRGITVPERAEMIHRTEAYMTEDGVLFRASCSRDSSVRVLWSHRRHVFSTRETNVAFINPLVTVEAVSQLLETELVATMAHLGKEFSIRALKRNSKDCELLLIRSYKVESTSQGLPTHSLVCSTGEVETTGSRARRKRRFDWITINGLIYIQIFTTDMQILLVSHILFYLHNRRGRRLKDRTTHW